MELTTELTQLVWVSLFTALLWLTYVTDRMVVIGIWPTLDNPADKEELHPWAMRAKRAHANNVENLVVFAALVLVAHAAGVHNSVTEWAAVIYLWARVVHFAVFTAGIPVARTLAFLVGWGCQVAIALQLIM